MATRKAEWVSAANVIDGIYRRATVEQLLELASAGLGSFGRARLLTGQITGSGVVVLYDGDQAPCVVAAGVSDDAHVRAILRGFGDVVAMRRAMGFNTEVFRDAQSAVAELITSLVPAREVVRFYGHSSGGMLVETMASIDSFARFVAPESITTFGAPKPGLPTATFSSESTKRALIRVTGDPVPYVPWGTINDDIALYVVIWGVDPRPWLCEHGQGGMLLTSGVLTPATDAVVPAGVDRTLQRWINHGARERQVHSIYNYLIALRAIDGGRMPDVADIAVPATRIRQGNSVQPRQASGDHAPPAASGEIPIATASATSQLNGRATPAYVGPSNRVDSNELRARMGVPANSADQVVLLNGPNITYQGRAVGTAPRNLEETVSQAKIKPTMRVRVRFTGTRYDMKWQGLTIGWATKKTKADTLAKVVNKALRVMGNDVTLSGGQIVAAFSTFLALAGIPGNGVTPPLDIVP